MCDRTAPGGGGGGDAGGGASVPGQCSGLPPAPCPQLSAGIDRSAGLQWI